MCMASPYAILTNTLLVFLIRQSELIPLALYVRIPESMMSLPLKHPPCTPSVPPPYLDTRRRQKRADWCRGISASCRRRRLENLLGQQSST